MPLCNACFISYRHGQYDLMKEFIVDFCAALSAELEPMLGGNAVYLDQDRLRGGDFYNEALAKNLYESATMVMVYTPTYFHQEHIYCAREYRAMEVLERQRLDRLGVSVDRNHGLIIPVVLRGAKHLPEEIKTLRQYYDFQNFQLGGRRLSRHSRFAPAIREIAGYICDRYQELLSLPEEVFAGCDQFCLPTEAEIRPFLDIASGFRIPFPGRGESLWAPPLVWARS
jgi:hypothetical protein